MREPLTNFPAIHRALLTLFQEARQMPRHSAAPLVCNRMQELRKQLVDCENTATLVAYEHYLNYYAGRFGDPAMRAGLTLVDPRKFEAILAQDPSRYDQMLELARWHLAQGLHREARFLLQKVASSCFREAKVAQRLLASLFNEALK